jgi:excinuclease UvrABC nuclease subunit
VHAVPVALVSKMNEKDNEGFRTKTRPCLTYEISKSLNLPIVHLMIPKEEWIR